MLASYIVDVLRNDFIGAEELGCKLGRAEGVGVFPGVPEYKITRLVMISVTLRKPFIAKGCLECAGDGSNNGESIVKLVD